MRLPAMSGLSRRMFWFVLLLTLMAGIHSCGPIGTVDSDPSTRRIEISNATFDMQRGFVIVQWQYDGVDPIQTFQILRKTADTRFVQIGTVDGRNDAFEFQDQAPPPGLRIEYRIDAIVNANQVIQSNPYPFHVPGLSIQNLHAFEDVASIRIAWQAVDGGISAYELIRQSGEEEPQIIYQSQDLSRTEFLDGPLIGNRNYTYTIRTRMAGGSTLKSSEQAIGLYPSVFSRQVTSSLSDRVRLNWSQVPSLSAAIPVGLVFNPSQTHIHRFKYQIVADPTGPNSPVYVIGTGSEAEVSDLNVSDLNPETLSLTGPTPRQPDAPIFVSGINGAGQVVVRAFSSTPTAHSPAAAPAPWNAGSQPIRTASYLSDSGHLFISGGNTLNVFDKDFKEVGKVQLDATPYDLLVVGNSGLWISFPEANRLVRGALVFDPDGLLRPPVWQNIALPVGASPLGLAYIRAHAQIAVLDGNHKKVLLLDAQGRQITAIEGLVGPFEKNGKPEGDVMAGYSASQKSNIYVVNGAGRLFFFGNNRP